MHKPALLAPPVGRGDTVAIVATSSAVTPDEVARLTSYFEGRGHSVRVDDGATKATGFVAGNARRRATALTDAFTDPDVRLVVPATGGKGAAHLLDLLDYDVLGQNPTVLTGMSDPSILLNAIHARTGLRTLHGPSGYDFFQTPVHPGTEDAFWQIVGGPVTGRSIDAPTGPDAWRVIRGTGQQVTGPVLGGHLGTIRALIGTPWMPDLTGAVLLLEEAFTPWSAIDQGVTHLRLAGVLDDLAALLVGVPIDCDGTGAPDDTWDDIFRRVVPGSFPIVTNVPFGHTADKIPMVVGGRIHLDTAALVTTLRYLDDLVAAAG